MLLQTEFENPADDHDVQVKSNLKEDLSWLAQIETPFIEEGKRPLWFACTNHSTSMLGDFTGTGGNLVLVMKYEHAFGSNFKIKGKYRSCDQCPKPCRFILEVLR